MKGKKVIVPTGYMGSGSSAITDLLDGLEEFDVSRSTFEFVLAEDLETDQEIFWVGEYNSEGFGRVRLVKNDGESCRIDELDSEEKPETLAYV